MALNDVLDFIYTLWIDDHGVMADRSKVREWIDQQIMEWSALTLVEDSSYADEILAQQQRELMMIEGPAKKRRNKVTAEQPEE